MPLRISSNHDILPHTNIHAHGLTVHPPSNTIHEKVQHAIGLCILEDTCHNTDIMFRFNVVQLKTTRGAYLLTMLLHNMKLHSKINGLDMSSHIQALDRSLDTHDIPRLVLLFRHLRLFYLLKYKVWLVCIQTQTMADIHFATHNTVNTSILNNALATRQGRRVVTASYPILRTTMRRFLERMIHERLAFTKDITHIGQSLTIHYDTMDITPSLFVHPNQIISMFGEYDTTDVLIWHMILIDHVFMNHNMPRLFEDPITTHFKPKVASESATHVDPRQYTMYTLMHIPGMWEKGVPDKWKSCIYDYFK